MSAGAGQPSAENVAGYQCRVRILYAGQGMANFIELSTLDAQRNETLQTTALVDMGVEHASWTEGSFAVDVVMDTLRHLVQSGKEPRIGVAVFSHQDTDHWGMLEQLIARVEAQELDLKVGSIFYGGADWSDTASFWVEQFSLYSDAAGEQVIRLQQDRCDYPGVGLPPRSIATWGPISLRILASNITMPQGRTFTRARIRNATSAIVAVECDGRCVLLPGDATYETFHFVNRVFDRYPPKAPPIGTCEAISVPHHGSYTTFICDTGADNGSGRRFAENVDADNAVASAGWSFNHPRKEVLDVFAEWTSESEDHDYAAFPNADDAEPTQYSTTENIFTSRPYADETSGEHYGFTLVRMAGQPLEFSISRFGAPGAPRQELETVVATRAPEA